MIWPKLKYLNELLDKIPGYWHFCFDDVGFFKKFIVYTPCDASGDGWIINTIMLTLLIP